MQDRELRLRQMRKRLVIELGAIEKPSTPTELFVVAGISQALDALDVILGVDLDLTA